MDGSITIVRSTESIGSLVRTRRKAAGLTQAQAAGLAGVGNRFMSELERGKKTVELELVLQVLERLGFELAVAPRGVRWPARPLGDTTDSEQQPGERGEDSVPAASDLPGAAVERTVRKRAPKPKLKRRRGG